jgi:hypothetical protein
MSFVSDFYISSADAALGYDTAPDQFPGRVQSKGITPFQLSMLWAIMRGAEWKVALMEDFPCLLGEDTGERLIHQLPAEMAAALSVLSPNQMTATAAKWAATKELGWPVSDTVRLVEDLAGLSRSAAESGQSVYLWNCV